jgi:peptide/nickel transport system substrate-binding protein
VLRIGMTAADIPRTLGQPDQGFEGNRFTGLTMYDALTMWDLSSADKPSVVIPGLATEWKVDDADKKKWTFKLRPGVTFHDGSPFNADAVVWNVEKVLKQDAPQFDPSQVGVTASRMPTLASARKIDDMTVELTTKEPDSFLPINLTNLFMASPAKWQKLLRRGAKAPTPRRKSQAAWAAFAKDASGTGPWKMSSFTPRERLELVKNENYWDKARVPKVDKMVLLPMPEANARTAALLSGQVDWIEAPAPDAVAEIKQRGFRSDQRGAACLAVAVLARRRLAVERHPRPQGGQSLRRPRRPEGRPARRPDGAGDRHLRAGPSLARQADLPDQVRQAGGAEADAGGRLSVRTRS